MATTPGSPGCELPLSWEHSQLVCALVGRAPAQISPLFPEWLVSQALGNKHSTVRGEMGPQASTQGLAFSRGTLNRIPQAPSGAMLAEPAAERQPEARPPGWMSLHDSCVYPAPSVPSPLLPPEQLPLGRAGTTPWEGQKVTSALFAVFYFFHKMKKENQSLSHVLLFETP